MLFNSWIFVAFIALVLPVYYRLPHRWQNRFLLVASYVFYGAWDYRFTSLLAISTIVDYFVAKALRTAEAPRRRKGLLLISVATNLGILGFFKYFGFFVSSAAGLLDSFGLHAEMSLLEIVLPVGISFYTFQTMAYTIDVYRRRQEPVDDFVAFALYVAYFPQLVAGPIERAHRLLPQIQGERRVGREEWNSGAQLILWGYVKKVAVADSLAKYVDLAFDAPERLGPVTLLLALYCFALQIYCDFSGYSDIARGISRLMGIELMENFRQPYLSRNITEFWRRWHISLSTWLRDYLYIPLGGNRRGRAAQYRNLMLTMLLGGLWHGANWTFMAWGGLHGVYLAVHKLMTGDRKIAAERPPSGLREWAAFLVSAVVTFHLVCLTWIMFRAQDIESAGLYLLRIVTHWGPPADANYVAQFHGMIDALVFYGLLTLLIDFACWFNQRELPLTSAHRWWWRGLAYGAGLVILAFVRESSSEAFIYFQF